MPSLTANVSDRITRRLSHAVKIYEKRHDLLDEDKPTNRFEALPEGSAIAPECQREI
jgi:hypothetical protein